MPMFTNMERMNKAMTLRRILRNQKNWGEITLQLTMIRYAHQ